MEFHTWQVVYTIIVIKAGTISQYHQNYFLSKLKEGCDDLKGSVIIEVKKYGFEEENREP